MTRVSDFIPAGRQRCLYADPAGRRHGGRGRAVAPPALRRDVIARARRGRFQPLPFRGDVCDGDRNCQRRGAGTGYPMETSEHRSDRRRCGGARLHPFIRPRHDYYPYYALATHFGSGLSPAFPERADTFVERESIPGPILNVRMVGGGYFVWQLGPRYLDFVDGRALPFSTEVSLTPGELLGAPPNTPVWRRTVERYGVNTLLFTFAGLDFLLLWHFCVSDE